MESQGKCTDESCNGDHSKHQTVKKVRNAWPEMGIGVGRNC